jgi:hypothetical protein
MKENFYIIYLFVYLVFSIIVTSTILCLLDEKSSKMVELVEFIFMCIFWPVTVILFIYNLIKYKTYKKRE